MRSISIGAAGPESETYAYIAETDNNRLLLLLLPKLDVDKEI